MIDADGWNYARCPPDNGDSRKICTIDTGDGMCFVGIRIWCAGRNRWESNGEPCTGESVRAWRDLPEPARGHWSHGLLTVALVDSPDSVTSASSVNRARASQHRGEQRD